MTISREEKIIGAAAYVFELGYLLTWFLTTNDKSSTFIDFHFKQTKRIIRFFFLPATICIIIGLIRPVLSPLLLVGFGLCVVGIIFDIIAAVYAYRGQTKKII